MDRHGATTQSAALAYYSVFSIAPILFVVVGIAGALLGADSVRARIVLQFEGLMGHEAALAVQTLLLKATAQSTGSGLGVAKVVGLATLLIGTTAVFVQLQEALNLVWDVKPLPGSLIGSLLRKRIVSFGLVLAIGFLLFVSLVLSAVVFAAESYLKEHLPLPPMTIEVCNNVLAFVLLTLLVTLIYKILPDARIEWGDVVFGALVTATLFSLGKWVIGFYLGRAAVSSAFGAAGSLVVLLSWVFYTSWILLFGAELTRAYTDVFRPHAVQPEEGAMKRGADPSP